MSLAYWPSPSDFRAPTVRRRGRGPLKPLGPRKPLRLDGRVRRITVKAAHTALAIVRDERTFTLPIARLSRVLAVGRVDWQAEAIAALIGQGVPIVFVDAMGEPTGAALPRTARRSDFSELLEQFLAHADWAARYDNWLRAQRLRVLIAWRRQCAAGRAIGDAEWAELVRAIVYRGELGAARGEMAEAYALVLTVMLRAGLRAEYRSIDGTTLALATDLAALLAWDIALRTGALRCAFGTAAQLLAASEARAAAGREERIVDWLRRLQLCVARWVEPWH